jgi:hypothetical protein
MATAARRKYRELLEAVADEVSPALESVDFAGLVDQIVEWTERQKPPLEQRHNASRTTLSYAIPENDVLLWRVAPRMKDGAKVEVLPRDSALLPGRARQAFVRLLEAMSPGTDLEPDRRFMIPLHNLADPKTMKQFLSVLATALKAGRTLHRAA